MKEHTQILAVVDEASSARTVLREAGVAAVEADADVVVLAVVGVADYERRRAARGAVPDLARREFTLDGAAEAARIRAERLAREELGSLDVDHVVETRVGDRTRIVLAAATADFERVFVAGASRRGWLGLGRRRDPLGRALGRGFDGDVTTVEMALVE